MPDARSEHKKVAEAALFVSGHAMSIDELSNLLGIASIGYVKALMGELIEEYKKRDGALEISALGDSYIMGVKGPYMGKVNSIAGAPDITKGALRILAYVGKNGPVMQSDVVKAFGTTVYDYVKELVEKGFISAVRIGRSKKLATTKKFLEYFNISKDELKSISSEALKHAEAGNEQPPQ
ncbi:MAG: SMC-Scp complex subunit ScpB [Candidatus Marsarchaeota archaeon]|nr:SMC-Scp complex subunit ScpB [Candidatus Marsarchaeota archaeon]MCL5419221.1 SMC-Scp complex subunit ScpB [Candidatus Marsarchaeota archaeon]